MLSATSQAMRSAAIDLSARVGSVDLQQFQALNESVKEHKKSRKEGPALSFEDSLRHTTWQNVAKVWFGYYQCAMLFGAATGGLLFGRLGDRFGRSLALGLAILCFSLLSGVAYFVQTPGQLLVLWFLASLGIGGTWPNGVALVSETWSNLSRPMIAGIMGTSANIAIFVLATMADAWKITPETWRWVLFVTASPALLGLFVLAVVPESPRWLALRARGAEVGTTTPPPAQVFRPPLLWTTLLGIVLATVPLMGGWGTANWMIPWADQVAESAPEAATGAKVGQIRSFTGSIGSLLGGWICHLLGRRRGYFLTSVVSLAFAQYSFGYSGPTDPRFLYWVGGLGFFSGIYFGWLPLFLPELFPTRARSTGSGVSFNFGRYLTGIFVLTNTYLVGLFGGDYPTIGRIAALCFLVGAVAIWFAPDTTKRQLED